jgi:ligand-binding sensor domain-containing protein/two-component sensor histidine kinase
MYSQDAHPSFEQYTVEDGLASSVIYQVKQDSKGYIWFATGNGVSRFNGYEFENFSMSNGLPDNTVFEVVEDFEERIWFVPISCKLSYYYKGKIYPFKYNDELQKQINGRIKTSFCVNKEGTIFLGVGTDGIYEVTKDGKISHRIEKEESKNSVVITEPVNGNYIYSNNRFREKYSVLFDTELIKGEMLFSEDMSLLLNNARVIKTQNNKILISYFNKLFIVSGKDNYQVQQFPSRINSIYEDSDGDLWVGLYLGGVYFVPAYDFSKKKNYLLDISVNGIIQDKEKGFWFGTEGSAVYYSPSKQILNYDKEAKLKDNRANCLTAGGSSIYVGFEGGFVHKIDDSGEISTFDCNKKGEYPNGVSAMFYDKENDALFISGNLKSFVLKKNKISSSEIIKFRSIQKDENETYWLACSYGLGKIEKKKPIEILFQKEKDLKRIYTLLWDKNHRLLFAAIDGLWRFDPKTAISEYLGNKDSLLKVRMLDLKYMSDNKLVIATKGAGVLIYDESRVYQINEQKGLCGDNVYKVCADGNIVWAATNKGLTKIVFSSNEPQQYTITNYTTFDGLASNEINDVLKFDDKIWVATNKGLTVFNPNQLTQTSVSVPLYINKVLVNDEEQVLEKIYRLKHNQNNLKINFIGLGFRNAGKLKYRYKMLGISSEWNYTESREIQFTTLPANEYTFVLSVLNPDGTWSKNEEQIRFIVLAPFWQKWWFFAFCTALVFLIVVLIIRYRVNKAHREEEQNLSLYKVLMGLKLKALRAQMNPHFTFNVMNSIQHFILNKDEESAIRYLSKFSKLIRAILNNSEKNTITISEELKALELYMELEAMRFEQRFDYEIHVEETIDQVVTEIPSMLIQPYVENAVKHGILPSAQKGKIKIELFQEGKLIKCVIEDNGVGRVKSAETKENDEHKSFGTNITQERLAVINELYNSKLSEKVVDLYDEAGNAIGTRVEIFIPID